MNYPQLFINTGINFELLDMNCDDAILLRRGDCEIPKLGANMRIIIWTIGKGKTYFLAIWIF